MDVPKPAKKPGAASLRRMAVKAICDPRTLTKLLNGEDVRGDAGDRARQVLIENGYLEENK